VKKLLKKFLALAVVSAVVAWIKRERAARGRDGSV
jgi:hypothetical protein